MKKIVYSVVLFGILFSMNAAAQKVYINPGHGQFTSNDRNVPTINYGTGNTNGFYESKMNCIKGNYLYDFLTGNGISAQRSRTTTGPGLDHALSSIAAWANNYGATVFISIHSNAANASANYGLICFNGTDNAPTYPASKTFGQKVWDRMLTNNLTNYTAYSLTNRNVRGDRSCLGFNLGVLSPLTRPGILTEATFHDYRPETHRLLSYAYCRMEAWNLYRGICDYLGKSMPNGTSDGKGGAVVGWVRENVNFSAGQYYNARGDDQKLPLNGVKVELLNSSGVVVSTYTTDGQYNGIYGFFGLNAGTYALRFSKSGYNCLKTGDFTVNAGGCAYRKEWMSKGSNNNCGVNPFLTLSLSSSFDTNVPVSNTQATGKTVYLWMTDQTGGKATNGNSTLTSSNTTVATIEGEGKITTKAAGTTTIKAVRDGGIYNSGSKDGATGTLTLTVTGAMTLTLSLSSAFETNNPVSTTQAPGKVVYLWMVDSSGGKAQNGNSTLTSSDTNVATIEGEGKITTKNPGITVITAVRDGGIYNSGSKDGATGSLALTVTGTPILTLSLSSSASDAIPVANTLAPGKTVYLRMYDSLGNFASNVNSTLTSSNTTVATIDGEGTIITKSAGTTTIKAVRDGGINNQGLKDGATGTLVLTVTGTPTLTLSLSASASAAVPVANTLAPAKTVYLRMYDSLGNFASNVNSTLTSSDTHVATIDGYGEIKTLAAGTTTITAFRNGGINGEGLKDGATGTLVITVIGDETTNPPDENTPPEPLTLSLDKNTIGIDETANLTVKNKSGIIISSFDCILTSDDNEIASVNIYGTVTGNSAGKTILRAEYTDVQGIRAEGDIEITVTETSTLPPVSETFSLRIVSNAAQNEPALNEIKVGNKVALIILKDDDNSRINSNDCTLTSSDETIATISNAGEITGIGEGTVMFRAVHKLSGQQAQIPLVVQEFAQDSGEEGVGLLTPTGDLIFVRNTPTGIVVEFENEALIELYSVNGILIEKAQAYQSYSRDLNKGVYMLRVNHQVIKFVK